MSPDLAVGDLLREGVAAVREAIVRSRRSRAWEALQERDAEGNVHGLRPYTTEALDLFRAAHEHDPEDAGLVHHLAIAHHARAWDRELQGDPRAPEDWAEALRYWRILAASGAFWEGLRAQLAACAPGADPQWLAGARRDVLGHLLDIHVDF